MKSKFLTVAVVAGSMLAADTARTYDGYIKMDAGQEKQRRISNALIPLYRLPFRERINGLFERCGTDATHGLRVLNSKDGNNTAVLDAESSPPSLIVLGDRFDTTVSEDGMPHTTKTSSIYVDDGIDQTVDFASQDKTGGKMGLPAGEIGRGNSPQEEVEAAQRGFQLTLDSLARDCVGRFIPLPE